MGIYDDHMNQDFRAYLGNGVEATTSDRRDRHLSGALLPRPDIVPHRRSTWAPNGNCRGAGAARVGYRVVAITDIALADDQFPQYIVDVPEIAHIDGHGSLILHGAFAGLTYNF